MAISRSQIPMQVSPSFEGGGIRYLNVSGAPNNPNAGQGSRMWANMLGNRLGIRGLPFIGDKFTNLADMQIRQFISRLTVAWNFDAVES